MNNQPAFALQNHPWKSSCGPARYLQTCLDVVSVVSCGWRRLFFFFSWTINTKSKGFTASSPSTLTNQQHWPRRGKASLECLKKKPRVAHTNMFPPLQVQHRKWNSRELTSVHRISEEWGVFVSMMVFKAFTARAHAVIRTNYPPARREWREAFLPSTTTT